MILPWNSKPQGIRKRGGKPMSKKQPLTRKQKRLLKKEDEEVFSESKFYSADSDCRVFIYAKLGKMNFTSLDFSKIGVNSGVSNNKSYERVYDHWPGWSG